MNGNLRKHTVPAALIAVVTLSLPGCEPSDAPDDGMGAPGVEITALVGATVLTDPGQAGVPNATLLVQGGRVLSVEPEGAEIPSGARVVDVAGRTIVPGLINAHGHVGGTLGLEGGHYTTENLERQLRLYAKYGVTTVVSLGGDAVEGVQLRDVQDGAGLDRARLFVAGEVVAGENPEAALQAVRRNVDLGVDYIKIRVDDNLGTTRKMTPETYRAVIQASHDAGLRLAAHLYYLEDAKGLVDAGADIIAHSVRDRPVDQELVESILQAGPCYVPTLTREVSTFVYGGDPPFFTDPFFLEHADSAVLEELLDPERQASVRENPASEAYRAALEVAKDNLATLSEAGVPIAFGTDTGPPARFQGYFEHMELLMMVDAGMSPAQALRAATADAARCMGLTELGTLESGKWADFLIVDGDPLEDITHLRNIESVWIAGARLEDS